MAEETPQEQFENYKKELGKQYMDGLISDTEYDEMLRAKEAELGLLKPVIADEVEGPECPSCGALITEYDTECGICGIALEPIATSGEEPEPDAPEIPDEELGLEEPELGQCPSCGAEISEADTVCNMCGHVLGGQEPEPEPEEVADAPAKVVEVIEEKAVEVERTCPSCGAFVEQDATECIICETPLDIEISETEPAISVPSEEEELPPPLSLIHI